jgi:hypothetical protein
MTFPVMQNAHDGIVWIEPEISMTALRLNCYFLKSLPIIEVHAA